MSYIRQDTTAGGGIIHFPTRNTADGICSHPWTSESYTVEDTTIGMIYRCRRTCLTCGASWSES